MPLSLLWGDLDEPSSLTPTSAADKRQNNIQLQVPQLLRAQVKLYLEVVFFRGRHAVHRACFTGESGVPLPLLLPAKGRGS